MDDVLADFELGFIMNWKAKYPNKPYITLEQRTTFYAIEQYPQNEKDNVLGIQTAPGFFKNLPKIKGGIEALIKMDNKGHNVKLCTAPHPLAPTCLQEKYEWVKEKLGKEWASKKLIITPDKTLVYGTYLIDDNPEIKGVRKPDWEQIIYTHQYNMHITNKKRITWRDDWENILGI